MKTGGPPYPLVETFDGQHGAAARRRLGEPEAHRALPRGAGDLLRLELGRPRVQGLRLARPLGGLPAHRIREGLQPADLLLLTAGERRETHLVARSRLPVLRVGTAVLHDAVAIQMQDPRDRRVQQADVVAHDHQPALVPGQELHEPRLGIGVEVVRRLVQQQEVGSAEEDPGELQPPPLPSGERPDGESEPVLGQSEAGGDAAGLGLGVVAAQAAVLVLQPRVASDVGLGRVLLQLQPRLLHPARHLHEFARGQDVLQPRDLVVLTMLPRVLPQVAERAPAHDRSGRGVRLSRQDLQGAGLAGTVASHDAHLVSRAQREREPFDDGETPGLDREIDRFQGRHLRLRTDGGVGNGTGVGSMSMVTSPGEVDGIETAGRRRSCYGEDRLTHARWILPSAPSTRGRSVRCEQRGCRPPRSAPTVEAVMPTPPKPRTACSRVPSPRARRPALRPPRGAP